MKDPKGILEGFRQQVDKSIGEQLKLSGLHDMLHVAADYSLFSGGKRARPVFALAVAADLRADPTDLIAPSCAIELLHTSSLVHDDLPAIDNDDFRRGRESVHKRFGEATAVLLGDALTSLSFAWIQTSTLSLELKSIFTRIIAEAFTNLCVGQHLDLQSPLNTDKEVSDLLKTGKLYGASAAVGGIFAVGIEKGMKLFSLGESIGLAYQAIDDETDNEATDPNRLGTLLESLQNKFAEMRRLFNCEFERVGAFTNMLLGRSIDGN